MEKKMEVKFTNNQRGFRVGTFYDCYDNECSIQKSSAATYDAIWFGIDDPQPQVLASRAHILGIKTDVKEGWIPYPIPEDVFIKTRMHLTQEQVAQLIPILQHFVDTGELPTD